MKIHSENTLLNGVVGSLEAVIDTRAEDVNSDYIAVCCHPHPLHGGAMGNKVIYTASRTLAGLGIISIRFNFRGVGKSEGKYADGIGEQEDLQAVVHWAKQQYPERQLVLAGFSFGAYITSLQAIKLNSSLLISIAPPIGRIEFTDFYRPECPWLVIQGCDDELVDAAQVAKWSSSFLPPAKLIPMAEASHFFHGKLVELRSNIESFVSQHLVLN
jgi:alpha/beta superfamily hydrolase